MTTPIDPEALEAVNAALYAQSFDDNPVLVALGAYHQWLEASGKRVVDADCFVAKPVRSTRVRNGETFYTFKRLHVEGFSAAEVVGEWRKSVAQVSLIDDPIVYVEVPKDEQ